MLTFQQLCCFNVKLVLWKMAKVYKVEALLIDTLVSGQLYLRPLCLKPRFNPHTNCVFLHSRKRPRTLSGITTFSLFLSSCKRTPKRKSTTSVQYLVFINQIFYIAIHHNDFTVTTVSHFNVCFVVILVHLHFETTLIITCICTCDWHYIVVSTL